MVVKQKFFRKMVGFVTNQEWKDVRSSITPAFTTGKIKQVLSQINLNYFQLNI